MVDQMDHLLLLKECVSQTPILGEASTHVWSVLLKDSYLERVVTRAVSFLSEEEMERACRFRFRRDRDRFIASHAILRMILGVYVDLCPKKIRYSYGEYKKPELSYEQSKDGLHFNMTHSEDMVAVALARNKNVGIDIEYMEREVDIEAICKEFFSRWERHLIVTLPEKDKRLEFFRAWTRREAYLKAIGTGLYNFERTDSGNGGMQYIKNFEKVLIENQWWSFIDINLSSPYVGTVAVRQRNCHLKSYQLKLGSTELREYESHD